MDAQFGGLPEIKVRRTVVRTHLQRATKARIGGVEIAPLKFFQRMFKSFAPRPRRFHPVAQADEFIDFDRFLEAFKAEMSGEPRGDFPARALLSVARDQNVGCEIL